MKKAKSKRNATLMQLAARGFALTAALFAAVIIMLWDTPSMWEFFLYETLPYYTNTIGDRLIQALPWRPNERFTGVLEPETAEPVSTPNPEPDESIITKSLATHAKKV